MSGYNHSVDKNQPAIIRELRQLGYVVCDVSQARGAGLDIIVSHRARPGINLLVEIKQIGCRNNLRPSEIDMRDNWPGAWIVAERTEEILDWFCGTTTP